MSTERTDTEPLTSGSARAKPSARSAPRSCSPSSLGLSVSVNLVLDRQIRGDRGMATTGETKATAELLTVAEVAERLRVTERFFGGWSQRVSSRP